MEEPKVISMFNDDGSHSHYALIDVETGDKLWSESPIECKAKGYPVTQVNDKQYHEQQVKSVDSDGVGSSCDHNFNRVSDCQVKCDKCGEDYIA